MFSDKVKFSSLSQGCSVCTTPTLLLCNIHIHFPSLIFVKLGEGCGVKETPQQKYQRLVNEIQELSQEVDAIQVNCH